MHCYFQVLAVFLHGLWNKSFRDWSLGKQLILCPSNLNVSLSVTLTVSLGTPVIKCLVFNFIFPETLFCSL